MLSEACDAPWSDFIAWLRSTSSTGDPDGILNCYRTVLRAGGASIYDIEERLRIVTDRMADDPEGWRYTFNRVYAGPHMSAMRPNDFMARVTERLAPGRALDVCMGQGRNALELARRGWRVSGFDVAEEGLALARRTARQTGVNVHSIQCGEQKFPYGRDAWDLIVFVYAPIAITDNRFVSKVRRALRRGGAVVIESFAYDARLGRTRLGALEIDPRELLNAFEDFEILAYEDTMALPDWGACPNRIVRLLARLPQDPLAPDGSMDIEREPV